MGLLLQKLSGRGTVLIKIDGNALDYELAAGQSMIINPGYLAAMSAACGIEMQTVKGLRNVMFGDSRIFNTVVTGPGHIVLQSRSFVKLAEAVGSYLAAQSSNNDNA